MDESRKISAEAPEADRYWQKSGERILLYLRCLNIYAPRSLKIALEALNRTQPGRGLQEKGKNPVREAMEALSLVLNEKEIKLPGPVSLKAVQSEDCRVFPFPPIHRQPMISEGIASVHWLKALVKRVKRSRRREAVS